MVAENVILPTVGSSAIKTVLKAIEEPIKHSFFRQISNRGRLVLGYEKDAQNDQILELMGPNMNVIMM